MTDERDIKTGPLSPETVEAIRRGQEIQGGLEKYAIDLTDREKVCGLMRDFFTKRNIEVDVDVFYNSLLGLVTDEKKVTGDDLVRVVATMCIQDKNNPLYKTGLIPFVKAMSELSSQKGEFETAALATLVKLGLVS